MDKMESFGQLFPPHQIFACILLLTEDLKEINVYPLKMTYGKKYNKVPVGGS